MNRTDYPRKGPNTEAALNASASLYLWGSVVDLLEGGSAGHCNHVALQRVIAIAKAEQQKELTRMDKAVAKINGGRS